MTIAFVVGYTATGRTGQTLCIPYLSQEGLDDAVHPCPRQHHVQVLGPRLVRGDVRDVHVGLLRASELHACGGRGIEEPFSKSQPST